MRPNLERARRQLREDIVERTLGAIVQEDVIRRGAAELHAASGAVGRINADRCRSGLPAVPPDAELDKAIVETFGSLYVVSPPGAEATADGGN
jgi:hypothetical protein